MRTSKFSAKSITWAIAGCGSLAAAIAFAACSSNDSSSPGGGNNSGGSAGTNANGAGGSAVGAGGGSSNGVGGGSSSGVGGGSSTGLGGQVTTGQGGSPTGAGGVVTTGAGGVQPGTDGAAPVEKLCAHKVPVQNAVFANFENYTGTALDVATQYTFQWGGATAGTGNGLAGVYGYSGGLTNYAFTFKAGHDATSNWALDYTLTNESVYGGALAFWMNPTCLDASAYKGISFWARGQSATGLFTATVATEDTSPPDATNPAGGGTCMGTSATCVHPSTMDLALTPDWQQFQIPWAMLKPGLRAGIAYIPTGSNVTALTFQVGLMYVPRSDAGDLDAGFVPVPGGADLQIDDVGFMP
jgi:hypothetical protein